MKFFFCDVCGVRVSEADLRSGLGMRRRHDVICATCLELGHGRQWAEDKGLSARSSAAASEAALAAPTAPPSAPVPPADGSVAAPADGSLAAAASGFSAMSSPAAPPPLSGPGGDLEDPPAPAPEAGPASAAPDGQGIGEASRGTPSGKRGARPSTRSVRTPSTSRSGKASSASTRALRARHQRMKVILITLVGLCVIGVAGLAYMGLAPAGGAQGGRGGSRDIMLKDERDQLFKLVRETRDLAFRDPHGLSDAEVAATIGKIHAMSDAIEQFEALAKRGGWSEDNVASQLASWNVRDITGKLRMWNDENAKRGMARR